jgi:anti-sigma regulatory factor (Ser/Thr protein kinase)
MGTASMTGLSEQQLPGRVHMTAGTTDSAVPLRHLALFYRSAREYVTAAADFLTDGLKAGERILVLMPRGARAGALRGMLDAYPDDIAFADMTEVGRNPARILPALLAFARGGGRARIIGEPIWPGRTEAEIREATRHEALINLALGSADATILCPYDAARLPTAVIADACRTHPVLARGPKEEVSLAYAGAGTIPADCDTALPPPPDRASRITYDDDLREVRAMIARRATDAGMPAVRAADLVLAVSEVAANTLIHTPAGGSVSVWLADGEIICQVEDAGHIADPLAGRRPPDPERSGGHGLWLVNRLCDLTQIRSSAAGTVIRMQMRVVSGTRSCAAP